MLCTAWLRDLKWHIKIYGEIATLVVTEILKNAKVVTWTLVKDTDQQNGNGEVTQNDNKETSQYGYLTRVANMAYNRRKRYIRVLSILLGDL